VGGKGGVNVNKRRQTNLELLIDPQNNPTPIKPPQTMQLRRANPN
jgi:hypothetical protein